MSSIIWIASFPKSGNTWVRFIIADLVFNIRGDSKAMEDKIPDLHQDDRRVRIRKDRQWRGHTFVKTHFPLNQEMDSAAGKSIYILRNPMDVLASIVNYYDIPEARQDDLVDEFVRTKSIESFGIWGFGDWVGHFDSWQKSEKPTLLLTYEDMKRQPLANYRKIADFLEIETNLDALERVHARTNFESLKAVEQREIANDVDGFFKRFHTTPFVNRGVVGNYREIFTADQIRRLEAVFQDRIEQYDLA